MNCKKMKHASKVGLLLLSLLFLIGAANALPASDKAPLSYTPDQIQAIASRILQGEIVSESEKIAADPLVQQLLPRDTNPPSTDQTWGPDGVGYSARDGASGATYFWDDILATGSEAWAGASSDDSYISGLPIGFTYPFYGTNYTTFNICANGFITFTGSPGYTTALPTTNYDWIVPQKGSSTANDNYKEIASRYMYQTLSNPTRLVVSFIDVRWFNSTYRADTSYTRTWQIVLYPDGRAQVNYRRLTTLLTGATYYGGIDDIGANGFDIIAAGTLVSGLTNYAIEYNPPCHNTLNHAPVSGTTGIAATPTLSWTNNSCVASSDVYLSTLQADVTNLAAGALVADHTAGTSYTPASPLLNNTVYYWRVVSRNSANATINSAVMSFLTIGATPMSGNYTIGGVSPSYATFTDAVNALVANSINGPVVFSVRPGTYSERITIPVLNGSSATNTVTFQKETAAVVLNGAGTTGATDATVLISGADYIIFDGIDVADPGTTDVEFGYWITNANATDGSSYNTIKNATITLNRTNANTRGIRQYYTTIPTSSTGANHYNKYLNLKISNARYGGYIYGYSTTYPDLGTEVGSTVAGTGNTNRFVIGSNGVDDIGGAGASYGLYMYYQNNASVHDIDVANVTSIGAVAYGVYAYYQSGNYNFYNNRVYNIHSTSTTTTNYAAYGYYGAHTSGYTYNIFNNFIYSVNSTSIRTTNVATFYMYGAYLTGSGTFNFDNNSVLLNQGLYNQGADLMYNSACLYTVTGTFNTRNNILYNKTPNQASTSKHYAYYRSSGTLTSDNNVYYVPNPTNGYTGYFNTDQATLANWQAASLVDAASWATNPGFVDDTGTDLHIAPNQSSTPVEG
ncbi:MAG: hypothetical protein OEM52_14300, partial [bacterium]|nr:hypothetical protein [bacterium]